jgi:predicted small lipoprotein YifL
VRPTLFLLLLILSVAGCGYKGPLYLPDQKPGAKKPVPKPVTPAVPAATPQSP